MRVQAKTSCSNCKRKITIRNITSDSQRCLGLGCGFDIMAKFKSPDMKNCNYRIGSYDVKFASFHPPEENISFYFKDSYCYFNGIVQVKGNMQLLNPPPQEFFESLQKIAEIKGVEGLSSICVDYWKGNKLARVEYNLTTRMIEAVDVIRQMSSQLVL